MPITLGLSAIAALWVTVGYWRTEGRNVAAVGLSLEAVLACYLVAGLIAGVVYAATRPWRFTRWGRVASGMMIGCCVGLVFALALPLGLSVVERLGLAALYGLFVGGLWGALWMSRPETSPEDNDSARRAA